MIIKKQIILHFHRRLEKVLDSKNSCWFFPQKLWKLHFIDSSITAFNLDTDSMHILTIFCKCLRQMKLILILHNKNVTQPLFTNWTISTNNYGFSQNTNRHILIESLTINISEEIDHQHMIIEEIISFVARHFFFLI